MIGMQGQGGIHRAPTLPHTLDSSHSPPFPFLEASLRNNIGKKINQRPKRHSCCKGTGHLPSRLLSPPPTPSLPLETVRNSVTGVLDTWTNLSAKKGLQLKEQLRYSWGRRVPGWVKTKGCFQQRVGLLATGTWWIVRHQQIFKSSLAVSLEDLL